VHAQRKALLRSGLLEPEELDERVGVDVWAVAGVLAIGVASIAVAYVAV